VRVEEQIQSVRGSSGRYGQTNRTGSYRWNNFDHNCGWMLAFGTGKPGIPLGGFTGRFTLAGRALNRRQQTPALGKVFLTNPVG